MMGFGSPWILWALAAIAIPVIIHLFYFRRYKKVYFSDIKFLQEATIEQKKSGRLQHILILLSRILAFLFLILAFALPFFGNKEAQLTPSSPLVLYIDNTFSMQQISNNRTLLDEAKTLAQNILDGLDVQQQVMILTNDLESSQKSFYPVAEAKKIVEKIQFSSTTNSFQDLNQNLGQFLKDVHVTSAQAIYISDFQEYVLPEKWDSVFQHTTLIPMKLQVASNTSIDSVGFVDPIVHQNAENRIVVKIRHQGPAISSQLSLLVNDEIVGVKDVQLDENSTVTDTLNFVSKGTPWIKGKVSVSDAQIAFDNNFYFSANTVRNNRVLLLDEVQSSKAVFQLFNNDPYFIISRQSSTQAQILPEYSLVVINEVKSISENLSQQLTDYVKNGGNLYIVPSSKNSDQIYTPLLKKLSVGLLSEWKEQSQNVLEMNTEEPAVQIAFEKIPQNLDLPKVHQYWTISSSYQVPETSILKMDNGRPFIQKYQVGEGWVYLQASSLDMEATDFAAKAIFAPLVYNFAVVKSQQQPIYYTIGKKQLATGIQISNNSQDVIKLSNGQYEMIPPVTPLGQQLAIEIPTYLERDGHFDVSNSTRVISSIACNYDRQESEMKFAPAEELKNKYDRKDIDIENPNSFLQKNSSSIMKSNTSLWKVCLILALIFLIAEILLIRFSTNNKSNEIQAQ